MQILLRITKMAWRYRVRLLLAYISFFAAIGFADLISFVTFAVLWFSYRGKIQERREACHRLISRLLEQQVNSVGLTGVATVNVVQADSSASSAPASVIALPAKA